MTNVTQIKLLAAILAALVVIGGVLARMERHQTQSIPLTQADRATQGKMLRKMQPQTEHKYLVP